MVDDPVGPIIVPKSSEWSEPMGPLGWMSCVTIKIASIVLGPCLD